MLLCSLLYLLIVNITRIRMHFCIIYKSRGRMSCYTETEEGISGIGDLNPGTAAEL